MSPHPPRVRTSRPGRPLAARLASLGVVLVTTAGLSLVPVLQAPPSSADTGADKARLDARIARLRDQLEGTSNDLVEAYVALQRTQARLPGARRAVATATASLVGAERHDQAVGQQLAVAQAQEAKAADALAQNADDTTATQRLIGNIARERYQQGPDTTLFLVLGAQSPDDFATRVALIDTVARLQGDTLRRLDTMRAEGQAQQVHLSAARRQVAVFKVQSQEAVAAAAQARDAAARAKQDLDRLEATQAAQARQVEARKQAELKRLGEMQAQSARLQQILAARAKAAREKAARDRAAREKAARDRGVRIGAQGGGPPAALSSGGFLIMPVSAPVSSEFGWREHPILHYRRLHAGIDFAAACGTPVYAAADGEIIMATPVDASGGYGNRLVIDHGLQRGVDLTTTYNHLSQFVRTGGHVRRGQLVAYSGTTGLSTGCHLHFETREDGAPVNPRTWF